jgi:hypothetical protein
MELQIIQPKKEQLELKTVIVPRIIEPEVKPSFISKPFIEANTTEVELAHLKTECIIPVFSKDNKRTIAHQEFIDIAQDCASKVFPYDRLDAPEVRVSHQIKGRVPSAIYKSVKELLEHEKTTYYERMAFIIRIPSVVETINGNNISLTIGGVRSYNMENLYSKKTFEKFKFFIGFQNMVCCNLCISTDGFKDEMRVGSYVELKKGIMELLENYKASNHIGAMRDISKYHLSEHQFAQLLGKSRLYQHLPKNEKQLIPSLDFKDNQFTTIAKDYYLDDSFCRDESGNINLWNVYNLFTSANKSSYIDTFLDRNVNAFDFTKGIAKTLNGDSKYHWFLS